MDGLAHVALILATLALGLMYRVFGPEDVEFSVKFGAENPKYSA